MPFSIKRSPTSVFSCEFSIIWTRIRRTQSWAMVSMFVFTLLLDNVKLKSFLSFTWISNCLSMIRGISSLVVIKTLTLNVVGKPISVRSTSSRTYVYRMGRSDRWMEPEAFLPSEWERTLRMVELTISNGYERDAFGLSFTLLIGVPPATRSMAPREPIRVPLMESFRISTRSLVLLSMVNV